MMKEEQPTICIGFSTQESLNPIELIQYLESLLNVEISCVGYKEYVRGIFLEFYEYEEGIINDFDILYKKGNIEKFQMENFIKIAKKFKTEIMSESFENSNIWLLFKPDGSYQHFDYYNELDDILYKRWRRSCTQPEFQVQEVTQLR